jgi:hypothetical protein
MELGPVAYPEPDLMTLGFQEEPLAVYQGRVPIRTTVALDGIVDPPVAPLRLTIQACNDEKCLKPEDLVLEVPLPAPMGPGGPGAEVSTGWAPWAALATVAVLTAAVAAWWRWRG